MYKYILFDLDGTISDSAPGITKSVQNALHCYGIEEPDLNSLKKFIGPPLRVSFKEFYNIPDEDMETVIGYYRSRYSTIGLFENNVYDGIPELVKDLKADGRHVILASSKPRVFVEKILDHFGILKYFDVVMGSEFDGTRENKLEIIEECLRLSFPDSDPVLSECVMIGDRKYDIEAAVKLNVPNIGVEYGFGNYDELVKAGADKVCATVADLRTELFK